MHHGKQLAFSPSNFIVMSLSPDSTQAAAPTTEVPQTQVQQQEASPPILQPEDATHAVSQQQDVCPGRLLHPTARHSIVFHWKNLPHVRTPRIEQ